MRPKEFIEQLRHTNPFGGVLTPKDLHDAQDVMDAGYGLIARRVSENYDDMTVEAVQSTEALQAMLCVFVEHACNFGLLRRAVSAVNG